MGANTNIIPNLVTAIVNYITAQSGIGFAETVTDQSDYRLADEERDGILGQYIPVPAVIVSCGQANFDLPENPCINADVSVLVRHSIESSTYATHLADVAIVHDGLWDQAALAAHVNTADGLVFSHVTYSSIGFQRVGRAFESTIIFNITVGSVAT